MTTIETTFVENNGGDGNYFVVEVLDPIGINITSIKLHLNTNGYVTCLYKKLDIASATDVTRPIIGDSSVLNDFEEFLHEELTQDPSDSPFTKEFSIDIILEKGIYAFQISNTGKVRYTNGDNLKAVYRSNSEIAIHEGWGIIASFENDKPISFTSVYGGSSSGDASRVVNISFTYTSGICFSENTPIQQLVNGSTQIVPIKNLQAGDTIMTKHGPQTLSRLVKQHCYSATEYIFFPQGCFQENLPSQDVWVTGAHPISLGYVPNKRVNGGKSNPEQDDHVFIHMQAADLVGKLPGIDKVKLSESHMYNLIFDIHTSVDVAGMEFLSHHPYPQLESLPRLNSSEYQDSQKMAKKDQPYYLKYKNLIKRHRPEGTELSEFLSQCVTSNPQQKFQLGKLGKNDLVVKKKETQVKAI